MSTAARGYLLDTSVISGLAPGKPAVAAELADWLRNNSEKLYLPCIAIAELEQGIRKLRRAGATARVEALTGWLDSLLQAHGERVLPLDAAVCRRAGQIADRAVASGRHPGFPDVAIAALAAHHGLRLLTRNVRHFTALDVAALDPFEQLPG